MNHPSAEISHEHMHASVDVKLADIVLDLWKRGIETTGCCQELDDGNAYIQFENRKYAQRFTTLIGKEDVYSTAYICLDGSWGLGYVEVHFACQDISDVRRAIGLKVVSPRKRLPKPSTASLRSPS